MSNHLSDLLSIEYERQVDAIGTHSRLDQGRYRRVEALRVSRPGGHVIFSSYSARFWDDRLGWFRIQSRHGLLGDIDEAATGDGNIVCKDGFRATSATRKDFEELCARCGVTPTITEVDGSSLFCEIVRD